MPHQLTRVQRVNAEQQRISQLTNNHSAHFKVIFSHQLETGYHFDDLHRRRTAQGIDDRAMIRIFRAFGKFFDDSVKMTISDVENTYKRQSDRTDATYDPETDTSVQVEHLCLYQSGAQPIRSSDSVRIHGYFRNNGGYFVVTRLDWYHNVHTV